MGGGGWRLSLSGGETEWKGKEMGKKGFRDLMHVRERMDLEK